MTINFKHSALFVLAVAIFSSCNTEDSDLITGETQTLDCDFFKEDRVLEDIPNVAVDYLITCNMAVKADITIEPGVTIAFATDAGIKIENNGSMTAQGTADKPITFTGEDAVKGSWRGIRIYSSDPKNIFDHCVVEYAGGSESNTNGDHGAFVLWASGRVKLTNSTVRQSSVYGLSAKYNGAWLEFGGNTFTQNGAAPLYITDNYVNTPSSTDDYSGNSEPRILVKQSSVTIQNNTTWKKVNVDYQLEGGSRIGVTDDAVLTIEPGVNIYFEAGSSIKVSDEAALVAQGTAAENIGLYGTTPVPGAWGGLYFSHTTNVQNLLEYVTLKHAGNTDYPGAIYMWASPKLTVRKSEISSSGSCGFFTGTGSGTNPNLTVEDVTFSDNAGADYCN